MFSKRSLIVLLAVVNLILAGGILAARTHLSPAFAQTGNRPGAYLAVTAKPDALNYHVVWILDLNEDKLFAFLPPYLHVRDLVNTAPRDLVVDFGM